MTLSQRAFRTVVRSGLRGVGTAHRLAYRATNGAIGGEIHGMSILLLTTTGRRSGKRRVVPLTYLAYGADVVVIASNAGMSWSPAWWLNLRAGGGEVQIGSVRRTVRARAASGNERATLWAKIVERFPVYERYQAKTTRPIAVVILESSDRSQT